MSSGKSVDKRKLSMLEKKDDKKNKGSKKELQIVKENWNQGDLEWKKNKMNKIIKWKSKMEKRNNLKNLNLKIL